MPRPQKFRNVCIPPKMKGFKPFGMARCATQPIVFQYDEYESIKLVNYESLSQDEAAERMHVSRPTLTRIYNSALFKISKAFVEGKSIVIDGGNIKFDADWYKCKKCFKVVKDSDKTIQCTGCHHFDTVEPLEILK
jgi:predicted DNA-binding protein (UPF0251 family)